MSKKFTRTDDGSTILAGVCGGIAKYFNLDLMLVRLLWVIFGFMSAGTAIVIYFIAALVTEKEVSI